MSGSARRTRRSSHPNKQASSNLKVREDPAGTREIRVLPTPTSNQRQVNQPKTQMASTGANFTAAINALVAERDRVFILKVATDYNLDFAELQGKYLETAEQAIKVPRKYKKRDPKLVTVTNEAGETIEVPAKPAKEPKEPKAKAEKQKCTACTSKKEPCKFSALKGEVFCKRHLKQSLGEAAAPAEPKVPKAKKVPEAKLEPVHTHALDEPAGECPPCSKYGAPLAPVTSEFEAVVRPKAPAVGPIKPVADSDSESDAESEELTPTSAAERLAALLADTESEAEAESDDELGTIAEEAYESD